MSPDWRPAAGRAITVQDTPESPLPKHPTSKEKVAAGASMRDAIIQISERCTALPDLDTRTADEILGYDERGGFR